MNPEDRDKLRGFSFGRGAAPGLAHALGLDRTQSLTMLGIDKIAPNPNQPRKHFSPDKLEDLVLSIRERGVLQPIRVREIKTNESYEIVAGERRWRAAKEIGLAEIPAVIVHDQTPEQAQVDALIENVVREDLNAVDRAEALAQLRVNLGSPTWDELARRIGITRRQVHNLLGLTTLPTAVQEDIRQGALTEKHGRALRLLRSQPNLLDEAHHAIKARSLSGEQALDYVRSLRPGRTKGRTKTLTIRYRSEPQLIAALEAKLQELRSKHTSPPEHA